MVPEKNLSITGILTGPTATGKTSLALDLVQKYPGIEIINADSLLVYREMDIGTAKPAKQDLLKIPHHLISIKNPDETFTAGDFVRGVEEAIADIEKRNKKALIVGGTGFYLKALLYGLWEGVRSDPKLRAELEKIDNESLYKELFGIDEESALRIGVNDRYRLLRFMEVIRLTGKTPTQLQDELQKKDQKIKSKYRLWIIDRSEEEMSGRIEARVRAMLDAGLIDEVEMLRNKYPNSRALHAVGYRQVGDFLDGVVPEGRKPEPGLEGLFSEIVLATRQLLKKQRTWFKSEKSGTRFLLDQDYSKLLEEFKKVYA
jgi:tRNA dimethylallyltransferase